MEISNFIFIVTGAFIFIVRPRYMKPVFDLFRRKQLRKKNP